MIAPGDLISPRRFMQLWSMPPVDVTSWTDGTFAMGFLRAHEPCIVVASYGQGVCVLAAGDVLGWGFPVDFYRRDELS